MIFGDTKKFAIETEISQRVPNYILGRFRFWIESNQVGDWDDQSTSLGNCFHWLNQFANDEVDRYEPEFDEWSKEQVINTLFDSYMPEGLNFDAKIPEPFEKSYIRFNIGNLGMTSFKNIDIFLVDTKVKQRLIWRDNLSKSINEAFFEKGHMQMIANQFCKWFESVF